MAYIIEGTRTLIFIANPRTGSTAVSHSLLDMGAEVEAGHHGQPFHIPKDAIVFQVVRCPFEVLTSLWWKGQPHGNFEKFVFEACAGRYEHVTIPMYNRVGITHNVLYKHMSDEFDSLCEMAGLYPIPLKRTMSRTQLTADEMFSDYLRKPVYDTFSEEMMELGVW